MDILNTKLNETTINTALAAALKHRNDFLNGTVPANDNLKNNPAFPANHNEPGHKPELPRTLEELAAFKRETECDLKNAQKALKNNVLDSKAYQLLKAKTYAYACLVLDAELRIAHILKRLPKAQGRRNPNGKKTKAEYIRELGLTTKQARLIEMLDFDCVNRAKIAAKKRGEIPSRSMALTFRRKTINKRDIRPFNFKSVFATTAATPTKRDEPLYYTQLFANAGIGEYYLHEQNVINAVASELLVEDRVKWYKELYPHCEMVEGDFTETANFNELIRLHKEKGCKMILASPPCQPFSKAGKKDYNCPEALLFRPMIELVRAVNDVNEFVMIENVPEMLTACPDILNGTGYNNIGEYIKGELEGMGHTVNIAILNTADYGTCQSRERVIITASKKGIWKFPVKDDRRIMLWESIGDLPSIEAGEDSGIKYHVAPPIAPAQADILHHTPTGQSAQNNPLPWKPVGVSGKTSTARFKSCFHRKSWDEPCNTITMNSDSVSGHRSIHPGRPLSDGTYSDARCLSVLELLRVTGLPDDYAIPTWAPDSLIRDVIGECFLPKLVSRLIEMIP